MANATVSTLGQVNGSGSITAEFLQLFSGEVLTAFYQKTVMLDKGRCIERTIPHGKSASFAFTGNTTAAYHVPGVELVGTAIVNAQQIVNIDTILVAQDFIDELDEAMNHYDVRAPHAEALSQALAQTADQQILQCGVLAARSAAVVNTALGGTALVNANYGAVALTLAGGIFTAQQTFDQKFIPSDGRFCVVKPAQYYLLAQELDLINKDWGGAGAFSDGTIMRIGGQEIVKSMNLPTTNIVSNPTGANNTYNGNFSTTVGLSMHPQAVATLKLRDLVVRADYDERRLGTLLVAKYAIGHAPMRPESAIELKTA